MATLGAAGAAVGTSTAPRAWNFGQCFGEKEPEEEFSDADVLSAVRFDGSGDYLATGDKGGRIVVFERADTAKGVESRRTPGVIHGTSSSPEYHFYTEFQSHEAEFDYLKSLEIEEKINQIAWCRRVNGALLLLSTNDKTIKLHKIQERRVKTVAGMNVEVGRFGGMLPVAALRIPRVTLGDALVTAAPRRVYANAHAYHINSISVNSDTATFLSADDLRVNLWNLDDAKLSYNIVDIKPPTLEELTEVITAAEFHPHHAHMFMYSSSRGSIKLADMRASALCDRHSKVFEQPEDAAARTYFSEIIASVSDIEFTRDGRYIVSRDYLSIKVWDVAMEARPLRVIPVHEHLRARLVDLYESDCIFDKFEVCGAGDGSAFMTGSYSNSFKLYDAAHGSETTIELSKSRPRPPVVRTIDAALREAPELDCTKKVLHFSWHPAEDIVAVAGLNNLYIYHA